MIGAMTAAIVLTPIDVAVAPARAKYHTLLSQLADFPCQCFLDVVPVSKPGLSHTTTNEDIIIELWRPARSEPPLVSWYRALAKFSRVVRREQLPWLVHMEDFEVVGQIQPHGRS